MATDKPLDPNKVYWFDKLFFAPYIGFCPNETAWREMLAELSMPDYPYPDSDGRMSWFHSAEENKTVMVITIAEKHDNKNSVEAIPALIAHECMHVWRELRKSIGERKPSKEFEAYVVQHLVMECMYAYAHTRRWRFARSLYDANKRQSERSSRNGTRKEATRNRGRGKQSG